MLLRIGSPYIGQVLLSRPLLLLHRQIVLSEFDCFFFAVFCSIGLRTLLDSSTWPPEGGAPSAHPELLPSRSVRLQNECSRGHRGMLATVCKLG